MDELNHEQNVAKMRRGELYYSFTPQLTAARMRCHHACHRFNVAGEVPRRRLVELWREYVFRLRSPSFNNTSYTEFIELFPIYLL